MVTEAHIGRELPSEGRTPKGLQGPGHRLRESKGGQTDKVHGRHRHAEWVSRGQEVPWKQVKDGKGGKHRDEWWRPDSEGNLHVDGLFAPGRFGKISECNRDK